MESPSGKHRASQSKINTIHPTAHIDSRVRFASHSFTFGHASLPVYFESDLNRLASYSEKIHISLTNGSRRVSSASYKVITPIRY